MVLNEKGKAAVEMIDKYYEQERAWLDQHPEDFYHDEYGWCIIDDSRYIKTFEDECALLVYGYDDGVFEHLEWWAEHGDGWNSEYTMGHTIREYYDEIETYFKEVA